MKRSEITRIILRDGSMLILKGIINADTYIKALDGKLTLDEEREIFRRMKKFQK